MDAEKRLLSADNEHGAFLIRDSESRRNDFSLSGELSSCISHSHALLRIIIPVPSCHSYIMTEE